LHAIRGGEEHVREIAQLTTLAGYVHRELTGRHVLGVGDASGMFPISAAGDGYDPELLERFAQLDGVAELPWSLADVLPEVLVAGQDAGSLTAEGAALLDPTGALQPGAVAAPPAGDAGTGLVATHAIAPRAATVGTLSPRPRRFRSRSPTPTPAPASSWHGPGCSAASPSCWAAPSTPRSSTACCSAPEPTAMPTPAVC